MRSGQQYFEDLKKMRPNLCIGGEIVGRDDTWIKLGIHVVLLTCDLAQDSEWSSLFTATSSLSGEKMNCFTALCAMRNCQRTTSAGATPCC